uniref:Uncharacterized protein n=1 Tax=Pseudomonas phage Nican01 TaxID=3138540 RepID=A0AAU6W0T2_9CAUD
MTQERKVTEVKVFEYSESRDQFVVEVNGEKKHIPAETFLEAFQTMNSINPSEQQTAESYCLGMIYNMHYQEEPNDLCYTFYRVNH